MKEVLTLGMRSTQVSESLNAQFKSCMKPNVNILEFFNHFEIVVEEKRAKELSCVYESSHKLARLAYETAPILIQMGKIYTHIIFDLFQDEFKLFLTLSIPTRHESDSLCEYVITKEKHEGSWRVSFNRVSNSITCCCKKFDTFGILCSHALKVFELNDVKVIPKNCIFKRWTREACCGVVQDFRGKEVEGDPNLSRNRMFRQVVSKFIKAATEASPKEEWLKFLDNGVDDMFKKIMELRTQAMDNNGNNGACPEIMSSDVIQAKGFRVRPGSKRIKRHQSCLEKQHSRATSSHAPPKEKSSQVYELVCRVLVLILLVLVTVHLFDFLMIRKHTDSRTNSYDIRYTTKCVLLNSSYSVQTYQNLNNLVCCLAVFSE